MFIRNNNPATMPNLPQGASPQAAWDPSTISNIVFGVIMVFVGIIAVWQGRRRVVTIEDEELVLIRLVHTNTNPSVSQQCATSAAIECWHPHLRLQQPPDGLLGVLPSSMEIDSPQNSGDAHISPTANRVTTLSTLASTETDN